MVAIVRLCALLGLLLPLLLGPAGAAERRVALVIGNSAYRSAPPLPNTVNDAKDVAESLRRVGFEVVDGSDLDKRGMDAALTRFARIAQDADAALFYFAGHGLQFNGQNYLVPVEAKLEDEVSLQYEMTKLGDVLTALDFAKGVKILVLDACRNNPFVSQLAKNSRTRNFSVDRGLAPIVRAQGMVIAYATQANDVAADGVGRNSPFTAALVQEIAQPGLEVASMFRRVQKKVYDATGGRQTPELSLSLLGDFYLNREETDADIWRRIRTTDDATAFTAFIRQYPNSFFAIDARTRLDLIERKASALQERERLASEFAAREKALIEQFERAEKGRQQAATDLAVRDKASQDRPAAPQAPASPVRPPVTATAPAVDPAAERARLAAELARREQELAALEIEKRRLSEERAARELAVAARIAGAIAVPVDRPSALPPVINPRPAPERKVTEAQSQPVPEAPAARAGGARPGRQESCGELLQRAQLGELSEASRSALLRCR